MRKQTPENQRRIRIVLTLVMLTWGSAFVGIRVALEELSPLSLTLLRFGLAAVILLPFVRVRRRGSFRKTAGDVGSFFLIGLFGIVGYHVFLNFAESLTTATVASIMATLTPVFTAALASFYLRERLGLQLIVGSVLALSGSVFVILGSAEQQLSTMSFAGPLLAMVPPLSWAIYTVITKPLLTRFTSWEVTVNGTVAGTILLLPFANVSLIGEAATLSVTGWAIIVYLAVIATVFGYVGWNYALSQWGAARTSTWTYLMPLFTALIAVPALGEPVTAALVIGGILVIAGVNVVERGVRRE